MAFMEEFNSFSVAIKATEKAISQKTEKKKSIDADWQLCMSLTDAHKRIGELAYELGQNEGLLDWGSKSEKIKAKKAIPLLSRKIKHIQNLDGVKIMDLQFKLEDEIEVLNSELRVLNNLKSRNPRHIM
jgi:uncharacterized protein YwgA